MNLLEERIKKDGKVINNEILKVDSFLNHQIDVELLNKVCKELASKFNGVDKIITVETSGIAYAVGISQHLGNVPVVFAKKSKSLITDEKNLYVKEVKSFTRKTSSQIYIDKSYIKENERCLIVDDFLAEGNATMGLVAICENAKAVITGVAIVIEKKFQGGRKRILEKGIHLESMAVIEKFVNNEVIFAEK
ncbi:MAG: xanthine phosphoribosyltransferase [Bacilli bacterium]|nr:xanthine phosphoribosyltransferase [Bacilli bacterium]